MGLVADIGGTNARFALAGLGEDGELAIAARHEARDDEFDSFEACVRAYLARLGEARRPTMAAFGVASPVTGDTVRLTNRDWSFSTDRLKGLFGWTRFEVVNDFVALGAALPALRPSHWRALAGPHWPERLPRVVSVVGPGTGFGVGAVIRNGSEISTIATEGGHASFAPVDALELDILRTVLARFPRVSNERILSGPGLENLHAALAEIRGSAAILSAPQIVEAAVAGRDKLAVEAVERFCLILGGAMGDIALVHGAGAVAIGGGMAGHMIGFLDTPGVRGRFEAKGRAQGVLGAVPIALITHPEPGLLGAARLLFT